MEIKETSTAIKSTSNVLSIGDDNEFLSIKKPKNNNSNPNCIRNDFRKHFCAILTGIKTPIEPKIDWNLVDRFGATSIKENNKPRQYHFYGQKGCSGWKSHTIISGPTFNAKEVFKYVKNRLKDENWISESVIETPLRTKVGTSLHYGSDQYIQKIVSEALHAEAKRLLNFIQYLHRNHNNK
ncbi:uncharacterized protein LOC115563945 [Drosophila navojoa]|uniref:uncharacterized protein LOC115563945 n=1 Tax=Drosophila navojoa TaxID=7232 RepID=UPI0011BF3941|nr:uncharacterized protein LOC115563945 [Drosophila navojoa]